MFTEHGWWISWPRTPNKVISTAAVDETVFSSRVGRLQWCGGIFYSLTGSRILKKCDKLYMLENLFCIEFFLGMPLQQLHVIFQAIIFNRITYAIPVWGLFVSADLWQKIRAFLKRSWHCGFTTSICDVQALLDSAMRDLFVKMQNPDHCLFHVLSPEQSTTNLLRERGLWFYCLYVCTVCHSISFTDMFVCVCHT